MTEYKKQKLARKKILERNKDFVRRIKQDRPCTDCKIKYHYSQMDFDHLASKKNNIAKLTNSAASIKTIKEEIAKCELVCSNCHRLRTWNRMNSS